MSETRHRQAINTITRILTTAACPNPEHTARTIIAALTGHGWRPTSAMPPPPWQQHTAPTPPSDAYRQARIALGSQP